ncbi:unnamed protein product [Notodromas monacha]|uniref:Vesicle transport protein n=1 Tax=Notodromas monacha TaxID=399045 RepID=A0A7R9GDQ1_9CRUS|nr:unnamed protein product [Notodromas monacha]CAG0918774.1 unnamed protein product [Notodromas monacha]
MATTISIRDEWDNYAASGNKPAQTSTFSSFLNVFKSSGAGDGDKDPLVDNLSLNEASSDSESCFPSLTRVQRFMGFFACLFIGMLFFVLASLYLPVLLLKARKFSVLFTFGSLFIMGSFSFLIGPWNHLTSLVKKETLPFSGAYVGTLIATLYSALSIQSTILTVIFAFAQVMALLWFIMHHIPGGETGMKFMTKLFSTAVVKSLPI